VSSEQPPQRTPDPITIDPSLSRMIQRVDTNLSQEIIVITVDKVRLCLRDAVDNMERNKAWQTPAGISVTIIVIFPASTFQDFIGISKDTWKALFIAAAVFFFIWLVRCIPRIRKSPSVEDIVNRLRTAEPPHS